MVYLHTNGTQTIARVHIYKAIWESSEEKAPPRKLA